MKDLGGDCGVSGEKEGAEVGIRDDNLSLWTIALSDLTQISQSRFLQCCSVFCLISRALPREVFADADSFSWREDRRPSCLQHSVRLRKIDNWCWLISGKCENFIWRCSSQSSSLSVHVLISDVHKCLVSSRTHRYSVYCH